MRLVEVDALEVRILLRNERQAGPESAAYIDQHPQPLEPPILLHHRPHAHPRMIVHACIEQPIKSFVLLPIIPRVHAVRPLEWRDSGVRHRLVQVAPRRQEHRVHQQRQQGRHRHAVAVLHKQARQRGERVAPFRRAVRGGNGDGFTEHLGGGEATEHSL